MSQLQEKLNHLTNQTQLLLKEIEKISNAVIELEQLNQSLIYENQQLKHVVEKNNKVNKPSKAILEMYHRGYHICTDSFSKPLDDTKGCLFCEQVIERHKG